MRYKYLGFREQGAGSREQGTGNREQGTGKKYCVPQVRPVANLILNGSSALNSYDKHYI
ncbi:hypothetical protein [Moorena producens]|uniref:hypothetical protein n=1 Tax=Moorena producens TaxID=1155739 RepID=UPI003C75E7F0